MRVLGKIGVVLIGLFLIVGCGGGDGDEGGVKTYAVGGTVSGLSGTLVLQNNGGDDLTITQNGSFTFGTALVDGSAYNVTVKTQPQGQICTVANGSGTISGANVTNVAVTCYNSGSLDTSFDGDGIVVHNNAAGGGSHDVVYSITTDANGKILVTGYSVNASGNQDMVIWRYNEDGSLDTTFDGDGIVVHNNAAGGDSDDEGMSITTDANGKILVTGYSVNASGNEDMVIWRYNEDGSLDTTFDGDGIVVYHNAAGGNAYDYGRSITTDANGRILVTGWSKNVLDNKDMVIWRYNEDGSLDTTFDGDGIVVHNNAAGGDSDDAGTSITIDTSGKVLVAGLSINASGNYDMVIWRYNENGSLDTTFDGDGIVVHNNAAGGNADDWGISITTDASGKILVTGYSVNASGNGDMVIWRYIP